MRVIEKGAVTVDLRIDPFLENPNDPTAIKGRCKLGAALVLDAMHRPKNLFDPIEHDSVARLLARMIRSETSMIWRVPILRRNYKLEPILELVRERNDLIAMRHG
jgi:hypothetical protein